MNHNPEKPLARRHCALLQSQIGCIQSAPCESKKRALSMGNELQGIIDKAIIARLEGGEYTQEQIASATADVIIPVYRSMVASGYWTFLPKENLPEIVTNYIMGIECPNPLRALENFINAAKEAVK